MANMNANLCMGCMRDISDETVCPFCGYDTDSPYLQAYLKPRTILLDRYIVGKMLRYNGEGATYIGFDINTGRKVEIREYMPDLLSSRKKGSNELVVYPGSETQFKALMSDFVELSVSLSKMTTLSSIVPVINLFEENNTVYAIYEYVDAITLREFINQNAGELPWTQAKNMFTPLLTAISTVHNMDIIHRGISPETIYVTKNGVLFLKGFSIASVRTASSELTPEISPGYAAPEQYKPTMLQGPFTDVYGIAAVMYRTLTGTMPPDASTRNPKDNLLPAAKLNGAVPQNVSDTLFEAMQLSVENRIANIPLLLMGISRMSGFTDEHTKINTISSYAAKSASENDASAVQAEEEAKAPEKKRKTNMLLISAALTASLLMVAFIIFFIIYSAGNKNPSGLSSTVSTVSAEASQVSKASTSEAAPNYAVPDLKGRMWSAIKDDPFFNERFTFEVTYEYNSTYAVGVIFDQTPQAEASIELKGLIKVKVSKGQQLIKVPEYAGKKYYEYKAMLDLLNPDSTQTPKYYKITWDYSDTVAKDYIIEITNKDQPVLPGDSFDMETDVLLIFVSLGSETTSEAASKSSSSSSKASSSKTSGLS